MSREGHVVSADRRFRGSGVARGILGPDDGREEEEGGAEEVEEEAEDVEAREVEEDAGCAAAAEVEEGLRVEGD